MAEPMNATRWGVRAVDGDFVRVYINGLLFDFDPRGAADLAQTIRVILGIEKPAPVVREPPGDAPAKPQHSAVNAMEIVEDALAAPESNEDTTTGGED